MRTYTLSEIRDGTGFPPGARIALVPRCDDCDGTGTVPSINGYAPCTTCQEDKR